MTPTNVLTLVVFTAAASALGLHAQAWQDTDLTALTGGPSAYEFATLAVTFDPAYATLRTHYTGYDNHVHELGAARTFPFYLPPTRWEADLTAATGGANSRRQVAGAFDSYRSTMRTHYIAADLHVHELGVSSSTGRWWDADLTAITGAPPASEASAIAMAYDPVYQTTRTHYVASDNHVHELGVSLTGQWWTADLTAMTGGPPAVGGIAMAYDRARGTMRTHYCAVESTGAQHLHELGVNGAAQWWDADLTAMTGAPQSGGGIAMAYDPVAMTTRTHYGSRYSAAPTSGNHPALHELSVVAGRWQDLDLTTAIGAPTVNGAPAIAYDMYRNTMRTIYRSDDWRMHELTLTGGQWQHTDLTAITGRLVTGPFALAFDPNRKGLLTHFVSSDRHVHELFPLP